MEKLQNFALKNVYEPCNSFHYTIGTVAVEMVDIGIQSETEDLSDIDSSAQQLGRKPSVLQVVPEEEHEEDNELVNLRLVTCDAPVMKLSFKVYNRVCTRSWKPGKSWNFTVMFHFPGLESHWIWIWVITWKMLENDWKYFSENNKARNTSNEWSFLRYF